MWYNTEVSRRLHIQYPIIQGPFGGGMSTSKLAATVSNAGGLGSFGANTLSSQQIHDMAAEIRALTMKPFALNLWVSDHDDGGITDSQDVFDTHVARVKPYFEELGLSTPVFPKRFGQSFDEQVAALLEVRPPVFSFVFGIPCKEILNECRKTGIVTIGTATTLDEALALDEAQVDLIVVSGFEAGGHRGSFLRAAKDSLTGTFALIPQVVDRVKTPLIAAGGIADGRGIVAALALGAQGVQMGTAFLACEESGASAEYRAKLFTDEAKYTQLTRAFTGRLARGIPNRFSAEMRGFEDDIPGYPLQSWLTYQFKQAAIAQQRSDLISLWAGQAAPLVHHTHAADLVQDLITETETVLGRLPGASLA